MRKFTGIVASDVIPTDTNVVWIDNTYLKINIDGQWVILNSIQNEDLYIEYYQETLAKGLTPMTFKEFKDKIKELVSSEGLTPSLEVMAQINNNTESIRALYSTDFTSEDTSDTTEYNNVFER